MILASNLSKLFKSKSAGLWEVVDVTALQEVFRAIPGNSVRTYKQMYDILMTTMKTTAMMTMMIQQENKHITPSYYQILSDMKPSTLSDGRDECT